MPKAAKRICRHPGCGLLIDAPGYCGPHAKLRQQQQDAARGSSNERGYTSRWRRASKAFLNLHPLCECDECKAGELKVTVATVVDHIIPHKGDAKLFWRQSNWQAMSKPCHDKKTAREDGGFGRAG